MSEFLVFASGGIASGAAIVALVADGFRKPSAATTALTAGLAPWVFFAASNGWLPQSTAIGLFGLFGSGPLFLIAAILYRRGETTPNQNIAIGSCVTGLIAGLAYGLTLGGILSRLE